MRFLELKIPPALVMAIFMALMWWIAGALPALDFELPARQFVAVALAVAGACAIIAGVVSLTRAKTTVNPVDPDSATTLVVSGIYCWTRNPMYFGFLLILAGWTAHLANAMAILLLPLFVAWMARFQIIPEERALAARFGEEFDRYRSRVRRWI